MNLEFLSLCEREKEVIDGKRVVGEAERNI